MIPTGESARIRTWLSCPLDIRFIKLLIQCHLQPIALKCGVSISVSANVIHQKQVLKQHDISPILVLAKVKHLLSIHLQLAPVKDRVFESKHRVFKVVLPCVVADQKLIRYCAIAYCGLDIIAIAVIFCASQLETLL